MRAVGIAGLVLTAIGAVIDPPSAGAPGTPAHPSVFHSYLYAYMFWFGVTTGSLAHPDGSGGFVSALSAAQWQNLWNYEAQFGVRQVTWYTVPNADYGFGGG